MTISLNVLNWIICSYHKTNVYADKIILLKLKKLKWNKVWNLKKRSSSNSWKNSCLLFQYKCKQLTNWKIPVVFQNIDKDVALNLPQKKRTNISKIVNNLVIITMKI